MVIDTSTNRWATVMKIQASTGQYLFIKRMHGPSDMFNMVTGLHYTNDETNSF